MSLVIHETWRGSRESHSERRRPENPHNPPKVASRGWNPRPFSSQATLRPPLKSAAEVSLCCFLRGVSLPQSVSLPESVSSRGGRGTCELQTCSCNARVRIAGPAMGREGNTGRYKPVTQVDRLIA